MKPDTQQRLQSFITDLISAYGKKGDKFVILSFKQVTDLYKKGGKKKDYPFYGYITREEEFKVGRGKFYVSNSKTLVKDKQAYAKKQAADIAKAEKTKLPKEIRTNATKLATVLMTNDKKVVVKKIAAKPSTKPAAVNHKNDEGIVTQSDIDDVFGEDDINDIVAAIR